MNNCFRHVFAFRKSRIGDLLFFPIHLPVIVLSTQFGVNRKRIALPSVAFPISECRRAGVRRP
jgi:hypothetical protein